MSERTEEFCRYSPTAIYYETSDSLEYIRRDDPAVYRRVDEHLTLVLDLQDRSLLGFKLKGFRHLYLTYLMPKHHLKDKHFLSLITVLEDVMSVGGDALFEKAEREAAYRKAREIAAEDNVQLDQFPRRVGATH
jgi:hypothetical protein